jgi:hypothetical protein
MELASLLAGRFSIMMVALPACVIWAQGRDIGPFRGGRADAIAGVASEPETFYQGTSGGGIYFLHYAANAWDGITDGERAADKSQLEQIPGGELSAFNKLYTSRGLGAVIGS